MKEYMRIRELLPFVLIMVLLPVVGWAQKENYNGQHVSVKHTTGDSVQYDISSYAGLKPMIKNGKVVWSFLNWEEIEGSLNHETELKERFAIDNVESIDFRNFEYDEARVRKALIEFYQAMGGDQWERNDNWCSDKPIWEWYGVNRCLDNHIGDACPWVFELWFNCTPIDSPVPIKIPECISQMGPIQYLALPVSNIEGELPEFLGNMPSLSVIVFSGNNLSGTFPKGYEKLPNLFTFNIENNHISGPLPENFILKCMNSNMPGNNFNIANNDFSGKVPKSIQNHPRFREYWPGIVLQNKPLDISDLVIPAPVFNIKTLSGKTINLGEEYKKNKYTLLYCWGLWCSSSLAFNQELIPAYNAYKEKGLEIIGLHTWDRSDELPEFLKTHDIPWDNALYDDWGQNPDGSASDDTAIFSWRYTPQTFLVDQDGNIVFNSYMNDEGYNMMGTGYHCELLKFLEDKLGPVEYDFYASTDYSHDGEVVTLQTSSLGQGVDLVFVGEGFTDKDIDDGVFDQRMDEAVEQFFAYEPYTSLRDRFNVYAVKTVSPNAEFYGANAVHAIDVDISKALEYASKVPDLIPNRPMRVTVVYNNASGGRSFCNMMEDDSYVCFAMDGVSDVLNHESGGHGIGKLFDEYVETGNELLHLPEEEKEVLDLFWTTMGWGANVDWRSDPTEVKWARFISDERYADEQIGVYEGSNLYQYDAYRPTVNSMMRYNNMPFNAPSREEIYKRVMKESEGESWTYDYETFVTFDAAGHSQFVSSLRNNSRSRGDKDLKAEPMPHTAPPVFLKGTWRDALKKNQKNESK